MLADPSVLRQAEAGLAHAGVQPEIAHQLLWLGEAGDVADRRDDTACHDRVHPGDGQKPLDLGIIHDILGDITVEIGEILR